MFRARKFAGWHAETTENTKQCDAIAGAVPSVVAMHWEAFLHILQLNMYSKNRNTAIIIVLVLAFQRKCSKFLGVATHPAYR